MKHPVMLGRIGRPYGIKGWVHLTSYTSPASNICHYTTWQLKRSNNNIQTYEVTHCKAHGENFVAKLDGIDDRDVAASLVNAAIQIDRQDLPKLETNEFYWHDLYNLRVINSAGVELGKITEILETGANDVLVVTGDKRHLLPYIDGVILNINLDQGIIEVDWQLDEN